MRDVGPHLAKIQRAAEIYCRKRHITDYDEVMDYAGDGIEAAIKAAPRYDPTKGMKFRTWCVQNARYAFQTRLRCTYKEPSMMRLDEDVEDEDGEEDEYSLHEQIAGEADDPLYTLEQYEEYCRMEAEIRGLTGEEQYIVQSLYQDKQTMTQGEVAARLRTTQAGVSRAHNKALRKLQARSKDA